MEFGNLADLNDPALRAGAEASYLRLAALILQFPNEFFARLDLQAREPWLAAVRAGQAHWPPSDDRPAAVTELISKFREYL